MKNSIDYLRAFSMLYIVGYWHLFNYTDAFPEFYNPFTKGITLIVLGLFVFISGFLIGCSTKQSTNLIHFYRKRFFRIYPLYVLAVLLFYIYGLNDGATSIKSLVFMSMFYGPAPLTLWFITMLILFYLVTPFLLKLVEKPAINLMFIMVVLGGAATLFVITKSVDKRVLLFFPCFCMGIYCSKHGLNTFVVNFRSAFLLLGFGLGVSFIEFDSWTLNKLKYIPMILSCSYLIFAISYLNEDKFKNLKIVSLLSYSSFAMYLFHRPIYVTLKAAYFPENETLQVLYLTTICLVAVFFISWGLQRLYDLGNVAVNRTS